MRCKAVNGRPCMLTWGVRQSTAGPVCLHLMWAYRACRWLPYTSCEHTGPAVDCLTPHVSIQGLPLLPNQKVCVTISCNKLKYCQEHKNMKHDVFNAGFIVSSERMRALYISQQCSTKVALILGITYLLVVVRLNDLHRANAHRMGEHWCSYIHHTGHVTLKQTHSKKRNSWPYVTAPKTTGFTFLIFCSSAPCISQYMIIEQWRAARSIERRKSNMECFYQTLCI